MAKKGAAKAKAGTAKRGKSKDPKGISQEDVMASTMGSTFSVGTVQTTLTQLTEVTEGETSPSGSRPTSQSSQRSHRRAKSPEAAVQTGPRADEGLLDLVLSEVTQGDKASVEFVYELLRTDEDVNQRTMTGLTPLAVAAGASNGPLVSLLLERRACVAIRNVHNTELPLHYAARSGNRVVCQMLAEPSRAAGLIDSPNATGWPALHLAVAQGHMQAINVLVTHGADVCSVNEHAGRFTPLHVAVRLGHAALAEALLDRDARVDALDAYQRGALHSAAAKADYPCLSLLLRSRADPLRRDPGGKTAQDLVPLECKGRDRILTLLSAFSRPSPQPFRTDLRFDRGDTRDLDPVSQWSL